MLKPYLMIWRLWYPKKYAIWIIYVSLTDFPEPPWVLASMFYHVEPDNDFAIRCRHTGPLKINNKKYKKYNKILKTSYLNDDAYLLHKLFFHFFT
jgi:hypothetical protein